MAALSTHTLVNAGTAPTFAAATVSDTAAVGNGVNTFAVYKNAHATLPRTVTVTVLGSNDYGQPNPDPAITVPALSEKWIPLRKAFADETGRATITVSDAAADMTVAVVRIA